MCTVSFLPRPDGGYLLGTNRDESPRRAPALPPEVRVLSAGAGERRVEVTVLSPTDGEAGGTWVALDDHGRALCVLNGDRPGLPTPPDAPSRGLLVLELMAHATPDAVLSALQQRQERGALREKAFKLLVVQPGDGRRSAHCTQLEWDGRSVQQVDRLSEPFTLVSSSVDPEGVAASRRRAVEQLARLAHADLEHVREAQRRFHATHAPSAPGGDAYSVCMHRAEASTVSFTQLSVDAERVVMDYRPGAPCQGRAFIRTGLARIG